MLAYQIAEHKGKKGDKYISSTRKDFRALFRSAMGGGLIVSFVTCIKSLLTILHLPIFWQGFTYGTNYALGFVIIDEMGGTLATKQPAYTASAVARTLDERRHGGRARPSRARHYREPRVAQPDCFVCRQPAAGVPVYLPAGLPAAFFYGFKIRRRGKRHAVAGRSAPVSQPGTALCLF